MPEFPAGRGVEASSVQCAFHQAHRIQPAILDGEIDIFIDELTLRNETDRLSSSNNGDEDE